jgi:hypothetical protein
MKHNDFSFNTHQSVKIKIIFPFSIPANEVKRFNEKISQSKKWEHFYDELITESSRHFDHIEELHKKEIIDYTFNHELTQKLFSIININIIETYIDIAKSDKIINCKDCESDDIKLQKNKHQKKIQLQNDLIKAVKELKHIKKFSPTSLKIIAFSTGIFFLVFEIASNYEFSTVEYYRINVVVRQYFKAVNLERLLDFLIYNNESVQKVDKFNISSFDTRGDITTRFQVYYDIKYNKLKKQSIVSQILNKTDEKTPFTFAYYFLDRNSERKLNNYESSIEKIQMIPGNFTFSTIDGVLSYTEKNVDYHSSTK